MKNKVIRFETDIGVRPTQLTSRGSSLLLTHVNVKSELILSSKPYTNFRGDYVYNRNYSSKFGAAGKAARTGRTKF